MTGVLYGLCVLAVIFAGNAAMVGLHHWSLAHPPTRARAVSSDRPAAPARVRLPSSGGRIKVRRYAPSGPELAVGAGGNVPAPAASQPRRVVVRG